LAALDPGLICAAVVDCYGLDASALLRRHDPHVARAVAAWLCRRHSEAPLRELALRLGLSRATSVPNLTRRLKARLERSPHLARELAAITKRLTAAVYAPAPVRSPPRPTDGPPGERGTVATPPATARRKNKNKG
jgi:hypothetical protein